MNVFGYCRVSSEMQMEGFSIAAQDRAIRMYCMLQGWNLQEMYVDEGRSARSDDIAKRPEFARMLADAEEQHIDSIIVHKLDRFARNIVTTLTTLQRLEKSGIGFVSINENMDFTSPIGKAMLAMLAAFAQFYSDNLSAETKKGKAERKKQGLFNGVLPFGTTSDSQGVPIPDTRPWACNVHQRAEIVPYDGLQMIFTMAASGASDRDIARQLNRRGHMSSGSWGRNPFTKDSVRVIVRNRFYLGELPDDDDGWIPGRHKPMIDIDIFERAQVQRTRRATGRSGETAGTRVTPFTGLLICGECGSPMRKQSASYYRCSRTIQTMQCSEPGVSSDVLELQVIDLLNHLAFTPDDQQLVETLVREWAAESVVTPAQQVDAAERLQRLKMLFLDGAITVDEYREEAQRLEALTAAAKVYEVVSTSERVGQVMRYLSTLGNAWQEQTSSERNQMLGSLFTAVYVKNRRVVALLPRLEVAPVLASILGTKPRTGGSDGHPMSNCAFMDPFAILLSPYSDTPSRYHGGRKRKLTPAQIAMIRMEKSSTLRELAIQFGVSHETIRQARR